MKLTLSTTQRTALKAAAIDAYGLFFLDRKNEKTEAHLARLGYIEKDLMVRDAKDRDALSAQIQEMLAAAAEAAKMGRFIEAARSTTAATLKLHQLNREGYYITDAGRAAVADKAPTLAESIMACTGATEVTVTDPAPALDPAPQTDEERIAFAAALFPGTFGLRAFPGYTFRVDVRASYVSGPVVQLYVFRHTRTDGSTRVWEAFSKSTAAELSAEIIPAPAPANREVK